jgi:hypothetical protein
MVANYEKEERPWIGSEMSVLSQLRGAPNLLFVFQK